VPRAFCEQSGDGALDVVAEMRRSAVRLESRLVDVLLVQHEAVGVIDRPVDIESQTASLVAAGDTVHSQHRGDLVAAARCGAVLGDDGEHGNILVHRWTPEGVTVKATSSAGTCSSSRHGPACHSTAASLVYTK